jgi:hypothetical protein
MERYMMLLKSFKRMNPELEQALRDNVYRINLTKSEILQSPTALNNNIYFVEKGLLHIFGYKQEQKITMAFRWEDQFVLTLKSIFDTDQGPYDGIEALEDSTLWCIPGDLVKELLEKYIRFSIQYQQIVIRDTIAIRDTYRCSRPKGGLANLNNLRSRFPKLIQRVPIQYLASLTMIPEKKLKHLLESPIELHTNLKRRRRSHPKDTI